MIKPALPLLLIAGLLAACAPANETADTASADAGSETTAAQDGGGNDEAANAAADFAPSQMPTMAQTAWRAAGEDGAVLTTFFDADGTYRDFKNGDALQTGSWEERNDGHLCFTPAEAGRIGECWELGRVDSDDMMEAISDAGKTIELRRVTYIAPVEES